jgi:hypothetical protein
VIRAVTIIYFEVSAFSVVDDPTEPLAAAKALGITCYASSCQELE